MTITEDSTLAEVERWMKDHGASVTMPSEWRGIWSASARLDGATFHAAGKTLAGALNTLSERLANRGGPLDMCERCEEMFDPTAEGATDSYCAPCEEVRAETAYDRAHERTPQTVPS